MGSATSFATSTTSTAKVVRAVEAAVAQVREPAAALLFLSGDLAPQAEALAARFSQLGCGVPVLIGSGAGVLSERGEIENQSAAAGLVLSGSQQLVIVDAQQDVGSVLDRAMKTTKFRSAFVLVRPDHFDAGLFRRLSLSDRSVFGAGTATAAPVFGVDREGRVQSGSVAALLGDDLPLLGVTRASRLITPLRPITRVSGSMLLEIDGEDALDVLSSAGQQLGGQPLIFVALGNDDLSAESSSGLPEMVLRPIQGVDPTRRGIVVGDNVEDSTLAAFAVRDAGAARTDLDNMTRDLLRQSAGAAPRCAIYVNCAGRGTSLYSSPNVDTRALRARLGDIPLVGLQSAFELAPYAGGLALHLYTGVLALFTSPS